MTIDDVERTASPPAPTSEPAPPTGASTGTSVAEQLGELADALLGPAPRVGVKFWDGSRLGPEQGVGTLHVRSVDALRRIIWAPGELGLARAFVEGDIDADGDVIELLTALSVRTPREVPLIRTAPAVLTAVKRLGLVSKPLPAPSIEFKPQGWRPHSLRRDAAAISHHYDVSNEFYEMVLGPSMTYSCARFSDPTFDLAQAQASKHEHICRKLGLHDTPGARVLDVGCGWGSMAIHAATHHGASVVGITISAQQAKLARERVEAAGVADRVDIRLQDYRELGDERFDVISSVGMSEHVGKANLETYFGILHRALGPHGRLLNHAISSVGGSKIPRHSFIYRYVFPDGELIDLGDSIHAMQAAGFEIRDVESLREHYATTLRHWVRNLESNWDRAVAEVGIQRARVWRLYMAASAVGFTDAGVNLHQVLGVVNDERGASAMPAVRPV
jgi:cyclopropane-fatty-acyl-phospholipid synthase